MRVLVGGWFGFVHGEATAGDLLAARTVCGWLDGARVPYDLALSPAFPGGKRLASLDPAAYSHTVFACGPAAGAQVEWWLERFRGTVRIGVGVSVVPGTPAGFDVLIPRDVPPEVVSESRAVSAVGSGSDLRGRVGASGPASGGSGGGTGAGGVGGSRRGEACPDLAVAAAPEPLPPVVALMRAHPQPEHPHGRHDQVHHRITELLRQRDLAVLPMDTRVDPRELTNRTPEQVSAVLARADAVVTTRLHGLVLALRHGVPALAVDPVAGGAKVIRQAAALAWPAALTANEFTAQRFTAGLDWCLTPGAASLARRCGEAGRALLERKVAGQLLAALGVG